MALVPCEVTKVFFCFEFTHLSGFDVTLNVQSSFNDSHFSNSRKLKLLFPHESIQASIQVLYLLLMFV